MELAWSFARCAGGRVLHCCSSDSWFDHRISYLSSPWMESACCVCARDLRDRGVAGVVLSSLLLILSCPFRNRSPRDSGFTESNLASAMCMVFLCCGGSMLRGLNYEGGT